MKPDSPIKPDYQANIEVVDGDRTKLRVVWAHGLRYRPYLVEFGDIVVLSKNIRTQLSALVANALERDKAASAKNTTRVAEAVRAEQDLMHALVQDCRKLTNALFTCTAGSVATQSYIDDNIRSQIASEQTSKSICFLVPPRVSVPWGLLFDGVPAVDADPANPDDFSGFWCQRHQVATIFDAMASPEDFVVTYDSDAFHLLYGGDKDEFTKAKRALKLGKHAAERRLLARLLKDYGRPATSSKALIQAWKSNENRVGLLYLFGHADARTIGFSAEDTMSVIEFRQEVKKSAISPRCLVFLNGCFTSNPDENGTFLEATGRDGFCGYIGAETEVPALFAFRFGLAFQSLLYQGLEVVDAMARLRRQHWPLSLIYGLYAYPHVRVAPHPAFTALPVPPAVNYSAGPLGERIG